MENDEKADDLYHRGYREESIIAKGVVTELKTLNQWYFEKNN